MLQFPILVHLFWHIIFWILEFCLYLKLGIEIVLMNLECWFKDFLDSLVHLKSKKKIHIIFNRSRSVPSSCLMQLLLLVMPSIFSLTLEQETDTQLLLFIRTHVYILFWFHILVVVFIYLLKCVTKCEVNNKYIHVHCPYICINASSLLAPSLQILSFHKDKNLDFVNASTSIIKPK